MKTCYFCGGELVERRTTFIYEDRDGQVRIVRNVPALICKQCGEKEYSAETTRQIIATLQRNPHPAEMLRVPAYDLAQVA
jgi:YgiT-type zinc finger domain-containing protein